MPLSQDSVAQVRLSGMGNRERKSATVEESVLECNSGAVGIMYSAYLGGEQLPSRSKYPLRGEVPPVLAELTLAISCFLVSWADLIAHRLYTAQASSC